MTSKIVRESISKYLHGPSEEDIKKRLEKTNMDPNDLLEKSALRGYLKGVKVAIENGANLNRDDD
ncbi:MAG: hypothetical protein ACOCZ5_00940, partial [bacterium]